MLLHFPEVGTDGSSIFIHLWSPTITSSWMDTSIVESRSEKRILFCILYFLLSIRALFPGVIGAILLRADTWDERKSYRTSYSATHDQYIQGQIVSSHEVIYYSQLYGQYSWIITPFSLPFFAHFVNICIRSEMLRIGLCWIPGDVAIFMPGISDYLTLIVRLFSVIIGHTGRSYQLTRFVSHTAQLSIHRILAFVNTFCD